MAAGFFFFFFFFEYFHHFPYFFILVRSRRFFFFPYTPFSLFFFLHRLITDISSRSMAAFAVE